MRTTIRRTLTILSFTVIAWVLCADAAENEIIVGSFNMEWLGHTNKARSLYDIQCLAKYIRALEVDVLCCQEIHPQGDTCKSGQPDWEDLLATLGDEFDKHVGTTGSNQHLAFIWRKDRVELTNVGKLKGISRKQTSNGKTFPRIPLTAFVKSKSGGVDFRIITVHLFFGKNQARYEEAVQLNEWLNDYNDNGDDKDVLIIGDFNTKPMGEGESGNSTTINNMVNDDVWICLSDDYYEYTTPSSRERYDHAFITEDLFDEEYIKGSWDVRREACDALPTCYLTHISNHCPVTLRLKDEDNDTEPSGDWVQEE
ncbi:hypothetical protein HQ563_15380 [bacterium]|nr:hypothetical protein [bacterium]